MADLNELMHFEKDLKNLIDSRTTVQLTTPTMQLQKINDNITYMYQTRMASVEQGQPYMYQTRMASVEQGQPYMYQTRMASVEQGQPYKTTVPRRTMAVREHGQPYRYFNNDCK